MQGPTKPEIVKELLRVYKVLGEPFTRRQYDEIAEIYSRSVERAFGSWRAALEGAKLDKIFEQHRKIDDEKAKFNPDKELHANWKAEKERLLERAEQKKIKWLKEQATKLDVVSEMLNEAIAKAEPPVVEVLPSRREVGRPKDRPHCTLWFEFSDLQLGTLITAEEMGGLNRHNWIIWQEKIKVWKDEVIAKIMAYRETHTIDMVVIACLGDMVEGQDIFKGQVWQIDRHVVDQTIQGANDTAGAFIEIMLTFQDLEFHVLEVFGNHGRIGMKGDNPYACSMDKIYQRMLELQLKAVPAIKNLHYHQNECWWYLAEIYGWNHLLLHGDQGMSGLWSSRPTVNGLEKGIVRYNQLLQQQVHFVHAGHFHTEWALSFNMSYMLINGSFIGTSTFSASKMVSGSPPVQMLHVFEPRVGLARTERLHLTTGAVKVPMEPKTLKKASI